MGSVRPKISPWKDKKNWPSGGGCSAISTAARPIWPTTCSAIASRLFLPRARRPGARAAVPRSADLHGPRHAAGEARRLSHRRRGRHAGADDPRRRRAGDGLRQHLSPSRRAGGRRLRHRAGVHLSLSRLDLRSRRQAAGHHRQSGLRRDRSRQPWAGATAGGGAPRHAVRAAQAGAAGERIELDVDSGLGPLAADLAALGLETYPMFSADRVNPRINWKFAIDTFLEGYHIPHLHRKTIAPYFLSNGATFDGRACTAALLDADLDRERRAACPRPSAISCRTSSRSTSSSPTPDHLAGRSCRDLARLSGARRRRPQRRRDDDLHARRHDRPDAYWEKNRDIAIRTVMEEDFPLGERMQIGFELGGTEEVIYGRNEPSLVHFHARSATRWASRRRSCSATLVKLASPKEWAPAVLGFVERRLSGGCRRERACRWTPAPRSRTTVWRSAGLAGSTQSTVGDNRRRRSSWTSIPNTSTYSEERQRRHQRDHGLRQQVHLFTSAKTRHHNGSPLPM